MEKVLWRINRLRCMTPAEVAHRAWRLARAQVERVGLAGADAAPTPDLAASSRPWLHVPAGIDRARLLAAADRAASGRFDVFALRGVHLGDPPRWSCDPRSGIRGPLVFGKLLDYRDPGLVGDIKYLWEPNRHLHLATLAQAYALTGQFRYFSVIRDHLESWFDACPYRLGPNWSSALEAAIRLINWSAAWQLLGGVRSTLFRDRLGAALRERWLDSVYQHAEFIHGYFSLYSSANNHLLGEASGLFLAALTWPHWPRARVWRDAAKRILEREALLQNAPDGVNREQAVAYQQFTLDFLLLPLLAGKANGLSFSGAYASRIEAMLEFLASIMDAGGHVPMLGDADDGFVMRLSQEADFCPYRSLLATGAVLYGRPEFKAKAGALDDKTRWLLGEQAESRFRSIGSGGARLPVRTAFPEGGYYVLGSDFETPREMRMLVDAGPIGYRSIAAHGHADALSFTLSVGGRELLIDPGTYAYHTRGRWRQYFRGTSAHNTVVVDGLSQSEPGGNFMWLRKASAGCDTWRSSEQEDLFEGWQDGYTRLSDPVMHRRRVNFDKQRRRFTIDDVIEAAAPHEVALFFHCSEACRVEPAPGGYVIRNGPASISLQLPEFPGSEARILRGSTDPIGGWVSRQYDSKQPSPTIVWRTRIPGRSDLHTLISC